VEVVVQRPQVTTDPELALTPGPLLDPDAELTPTPQLDGVDPQSPWASPPILRAPSAAPAQPGPVAVRRTQPPLAARAGRPEAGPPPLPPDAAAAGAPPPLPPPSGPDWPAPGAPSPQAQPVPAWPAGQAQPWPAGQAQPWPAGQAQPWPAGQAQPWPAGQAQAPGQPPAAGQPYPPGQPQPTGPAQPWPPAQGPPGWPATQGQPQPQPWPPAQGPPGWPPAQGPGYPNWPPAQGPGYPNWPPAQGPPGWPPAQGPLAGQPQPWSQAQGPPAWPAHPAMPPGYPPPQERSLTADLAGISPFADTGSLGAPAGVAASRARSRRRRALVFGLTGLLVASLVVAVLLFMVLPFGEEGGTIEVISVPEGAQVSFEGQKLDRRTPVVIPVVDLKKTYAVEVSMSNYQPWRRSLTLTAEDSRVRILAVLTPIYGRLDVRSTPSGADVYVNGEHRGKTPRTIENLLPTEEVSLELRMRGFKPATRVLKWENQTYLVEEDTLQPSR